MKKKKLKPKWKNIILLIIILVCIITLFISTKDIIKWMIDSNKTEEQIEKITEMVEIEEVEESENTEIIEQKEEPPKENPYWDYIKMNMINVNFNDLKQKNPDTKGWIQVNGTNINYPFVQTNNNEFYLNHTFNKTYNSAGWVFLDYRNNIKELSKNTIIYAHGRLDTTMFGSLKNILSSGWLNNTTNYVVKLSTEIENTLWQVFSIYHIPTTNDYIKVNFSSTNEFTKWSKMLLKRSAHNFNTTINENDKVLTLSTCFNDKEKVVLHAKLIKKETRY
jgi:sortase B